MPPPHMGDDHDVVLATRRPAPQRALLADRGAQPDSGHIIWPMTASSVELAVDRATPGVPHAAATELCLGYQTRQNGVCPSELETRRHQLVEENQDLRP